MTVAINIILILASLVLIVAVLMQEGNKQGLGAIGGAAETFLGKNKSKGYEGKLLLITKITAGVFVALAILLTWLNSQTYTVRYFADGKEYYPEVEFAISLDEAFNGIIYSEEEREVIRNQRIANTPHDELVSKYAYNENIPALPVPAKTGYVGKWDIELPEKMGRTNYTLNAEYTKDVFTLTYVVDGEPVATGEFEFEDKITLAAPELPEKEGLVGAWDIEVPETMPGYDLTITAVYTDPNAVATPAEATPAEATPAEATPDEAFEPTVAPEPDDDATISEPTPSEPEGEADGTQD